MSGDCGTDNADYVPNIVHHTNLSKFPLPNNLVFQEALAEIFVAAVAQVAAGGAGPVP